MEQIAYGHSRIPLSVLVHITSGDKKGMMQVAWPSLFRGIEQPDEEHPSQALEKLMKRFAEEHPHPFEELKKLAEEYYLSSKTMDFLEKPLEGTLNGMVVPPIEPPQPLDRMRDEWFLNRQICSSEMREAYLNRMDYEFRNYWVELEKALPYEISLTTSYLTWLAKRMGSTIKRAVGGWGNLGLDASLTTKDVPDLRRDEKIPFKCMAGYDPTNEFDMEKHNREAFLAVYERGDLTWQKGHTILIAYGREIQTVETLKEARALADKLKFFDDEYLAVPLTRETFVELAGKNK